MSDLWTDAEGRDYDRPCTCTHPRRDSHLRAGLLGYCKEPTCSCALYTEPAHSGTPDEDCPCNTGTAQTEIPTLMGQTIHIDACTTWGIGLSIRDDEGGDGCNTQLSVGQARDLATALTAAADAIETAVTA